MFPLDFPTFSPRSLKDTPFLSLYQPISWRSRRDFSTCRHKYRYRGSPGEILSSTPQIRRSLPSRDKGKNALRALPVLHHPKSETRLSKRGYPPSMTLPGFRLATRSGAPELHPDSHCRLPASMHKIQGMIAQGNGQRITFLHHVCHLSVCELTTP